MQADPLEATTIEVTKTWADETPSRQETLSIADLFGYLVGSRSSIEKVLQCDRSLLYGVALVFTAAVAREYDAVSLIHRPWDLLGPFAASLVLSLILYLFVTICYAVVRKDSDDAYLINYKSFLAAYWWTAPLAWLYAIPIEIMSSEVYSLRFNLTLLSIVSIWRVLLFSRVVGIMLRVPLWASLSWVLVPCMAVAFFALLNRLLSVVSIMGGLRLTQTQQILHNYHSGVLGIIFYGALPVLIVSVVSFVVLRKRDRMPQPSTTSNVTLSPGKWWIPSIAMVIFLGGATYFQPDLFRAHQVDRLLESDRVTEAITVMLQHGEDGFPRTWDPPPTFPDGNPNRPQMKTLLNAIQTMAPESWIVDRLLVQADEITLRQFGWFQGVGSLRYLENGLAYEGADKLLDLLIDLRLLQSVLSPDSPEGERIGDIIAATERAQKRAVEIDAANPVLMMGSDPDETVNSSDVMAPE